MELEPVGQYTLEITRKIFIAVIMVKTSLVTQTVKNLPTVQETWVQFLGWADSLVKGMETHSSILAWKNPMDRGAWQAAVHGVAKSWTPLSH